MPDVFVSYSRRDADFVARLTESIEQGGRSVWVDTQGIADADVFPRAIRTAIESSDAFLFVITPESVGSRFCENEVEYARDLQKRIVPVLREAVPDERLHEEIRDRNWIPFLDDEQFDASLQRLTGALDTDLAYVKSHTHWLVKALEWDNAGRDSSFLLRGSELKLAETWLGAASGRSDPEPTQLQREYLIASREAATRRQRLLVGASLAVAAAAIALLIFALISRGQAISEKVTADAQALASQSEGELTVDPEISVLLGMRAVQTSPVPTAMFALREALDASPLQLALPIGTEESCGSSGGLPSATYSPDGDQILAGRCDGSLALIGAATGAVDRVAHLGSPALAVAYSPNGSLLAVGTSTGLDLLDRRTLTVRVRLGGFGAADRVAFSPDGATIAVASTNAIALWNVRTHQRRRLESGAGQDYIAVFSPDGRQLITQGGMGPIAVYDLRSGRVVHRLADGYQDSVALAVSPTTRRLAYSWLDGNDGLVQTVSTTTFAHPSTVTRLPDTPVSALAYSPDGTRLAVGAADGTAAVWAPLSDDKLASLVGHTDAVSAMAFSPDGERVVTSSFDGTLRQWRAGASEQLDIRTSQFTLVTGDYAALAGRLVVPEALANGGAIASWSLPGGRALGSFRVYRAPKGPDATSVQVTANGAEAVVFNELTSAPVVIWSVPAHRVLRRLPAMLVAAAQPTADGQRIAISLQNQGEEIVSLHGARTVTLGGGTPACASVVGGYAYLAFTPDGRYLAGADGCGEVTVWNAATGRVVSRPFPEGGAIDGIAFSPDDVHVAIASSDSSATIWNVRTGATVQLTGHTRGVTGVAYSPNGSEVLTASDDGTARLWDAAAQRQLRVYQEPDPVQLPAFGPHGDTVFTDDDDGIIRRWSTCPACDDPSALLALARRSQRGIFTLTELERAALRGS